MKLLGRIKVPTNKQTVTFVCPNLSSQKLIPSYVTITEVVAGEETAPKDISCKLSVGNIELYNCGEAYFNISNEFDLASCLLNISKCPKLEVGLSNRSSNVKNMAITVTYTESIGQLIYQDKVDHFEDVLRSVHRSGLCTKLILSFNRPLKSLACATTVECLDVPEEWVQPFEIISGDNGDTDPSEPVLYGIECNGELFTQFFEYMQLRVEDDAPEEVKKVNPLVLYVMAYGFPRM